MKKFDDLYNLVLIAENNIQLSQPSSSNFVNAYEKINSFVQTGNVESISDLLGKINYEQLEKSNIKKEDITKVINLANKSIPGLNGMTLNDLFSPKYFIANLYNALNNYNTNPEPYNSILEAYQEYKKQPNPDTLANLIIVTNTVNVVGKLGVFLKTTLRGILTYLPGTTTMSSLLLGSIAISSTSMLTLTDDLNSMVAPNSSNLPPGQILTDVVKDSIKYYAIGAVSGAAALTAGGKAIDKTKEVAGNIKDKASEIANKVIDNQKEQLQKLKDSGWFNKPSGSRATNTSTMTPKVQLRGKIGATTPAKY